ncbi:Aste57867_13148 [Aphanomyces stellatus]|uniref:Aste57867_13148 protein n=1 Tax=Aphanomyces stellatus TaxID=120398 RepID=A0A485KY92_9STRA|nr:hypothetical protein As57867_013099 [Aphanomyces stellatus]VFT89989.1 Aste57867_13148 [Aphanomyces stellatus]
MEASGVNPFQLEGGSVYAVRGKSHVQRGAFYSLAASCAASCERVLMLAPFLPMAAKILADILHPHNVAALAGIQMETISSLPDVLTMLSCISAEVDDRRPRRLFLDISALCPPNYDIFGMQETALVRATCLAMKRAARLGRLAVVLMDCSASSPLWSSAHHVLLTVRDDQRVVDATATLTGAALSYSLDDLFTLRARLYEQQEQSTTS